MTKVSLLSPGEGEASYSVSLLPTVRTPKGELGFCKTQAAGAVLGKIAQVSVVGRGCECK